MYKQKVQTTSIFQTATCCRIYYSWTVELSGKLPHPGPLSLKFLASQDLKKFRKKEYLSTTTCSNGERIVAIKKTLVCWSLLIPTIAQNRRVRSWHVNLGYRGISWFQSRLKYPWNISRKGSINYRSFESFKDTRFHETRRNIVETQTWNTSNEWFGKGTLVA